MSEEDPIHNSPEVIESSNEAANILGNMKKNDSKKKTGDVKENE